MIKYSNLSLETDIIVSFDFKLSREVTGITTPAFTQTLTYETGGNPCYNGNIGGMTVTYAGGNTVTRTFGYDLMDRLTSMTSS